MILEQLGLLRRDLKSSGTEGGQKLSEDPEMTPGICGVNSGVIQITQDFRGREMMKGLCDESGVCGGCIGQSKGHLINWYWPNGEEKAVFSRSARRTGTAWKAPAPSRAEKTRLPERRDKLSAMLGKWKASFLVTAFNRR